MTTETSCGSPARRRASARRWRAPARGPTPRSSASPGVSTPTSRRCGSTSPTWTRGTRSASTSPSASPPSAASARSSSTTRSTTGAAARTWARAIPANHQRRGHRQQCRRRSCSATCSSVPRSRRSTRGSTSASCRSRRRRRASPTRARDLRRVQGGDGAMGARGARRARGPRQGSVGLGHPPRLRRHTRGTPRGRAPATTPTRASPASPRRSATGNMLAADESRREHLELACPRRRIAKPVLLFGEAVGVTT